MSFQLIIAFWFDRRKKSKFDTRMRETMAKKTVEQDAASDQEETRRTRESLLNWKTLIELGMVVNEGKLLEYSILISQI